MNITICWAEASSYASACFRALAALPGVQLRVVHLELLKDPPPWQDDLFAGIANRVFRVRDEPSESDIRAAIAESRPDIIILAGWLFRPYVSAALHPQFKEARVVVGMDTPWRNALSQHLNRIRLSRLVGRASRFVVAGESSRQYARRLGVPDANIRTGYYGCDHKTFAWHGEARTDQSDGWPRSFLFAGRYIPEKDLATLVTAYNDYRNLVAEPWDLVCTGTGPLEPWLNLQPHVNNLGYTQPHELPAIFAKHGTFVLPSVYEPWGVVVAEAAASGMPVICTTACGAGSDIVRPFYNGLIVPPNSRHDLARAMLWIDKNASELHLMGQRGRCLAEAFSADAWAARWHNYLLDVLGDSVGQQDRH